MTYERETIEHIRSEVDRHDKYQELDGSSATGAPPKSTKPRIFLCAEVRRSLTVSAYSNILSEDLSIKDFITPLLNLLQGRIAHSARFNQVSYYNCHHLHTTDVAGQNVFLMPSLLSIPRDW